MNIVKATDKFEEWLGRHIHVVKADLKLKHQRMAESLFPFMRATFYRWLQVWPEVCSDVAAAPQILGVGDLHVENFGTWRDTDGRLVWGVNDFDEVCYFPYTIDLVRLTTSAVLASREATLSFRPKDAAEAILEGYEKGLADGGRPFVLGEEHVWLRAIAESKLRDPVVFWQKMEKLPPERGEVPASALAALEHMLPEAGMRYRLAHRIAGLGSLGHVRSVAIAEWRGGRVAREAKSLAPSSFHWLNPKIEHAEILYAVLVRRSVRCPDPYVQLFGQWIVRRLSPHCSRIELDALGSARGECRLLEAMGRETANIHLGSPEKRKAIRKDLQRRKGKWLLSAAQAMAEAAEKDWRVWRQHQQA
jgi:hypothetical protein